jgi:hypothetical protein
MGPIPLLHSQATVLWRFALRKLSVVPNKRTFLSLAFWGILGMGELFMPVRQPIVRAPFVPTPIIAKSHKVAPSAMVAPAAEVHHKGQVSVDDFGDNGVEMHPFLSTFVTQFSGTVSCGEMPCSAGTVEIDLDSEHQQIQKQVSVEPNGQFTVNVSLQELPDAPLDWKMIARSPESPSQLVEGRLILNRDNGDFAINRSIAL